MDRQLATARDELEAKFANKPITQTSEGGRQSQLDYRFDLIDEHAIMQLAHVLWYGEQRYGKDNWRLIPKDQNINRAIYHLYAYLQGDSSEAHLAHAFTRIMFALGHDNPAHAERAAKVKLPG